MKCKCECDDEKQQARMNSDEWYEGRRVAMMRDDRRQHVVMGANERERQQVMMINDR